MSPLIRATALSCFIASLGTAQDATEAAGPKTDLLARVLQADDDSRAKALMSFIQDQIDSGATYAGQYEGLAGGGEAVTALLQEWITDTPSEVFTQAAFRTACMNALRDTVTEPSDELRAALEVLAADEFEEDQIKRNAMYALAQFGQRDLVDKLVQSAMKSTSATDLNQQYQGWSALSDIYHNLREYESAAKARKQMIRIFSAAGQPTPPGVYYNTACSLALSGNKDEAFELLQKAFEADSASGERQLGRRLVETDMDIASLREDERFGELFGKHYGAGDKAESQDKAAHAEPKGEHKNP